MKVWLITTVVLRQIELILFDSMDRNLQNNHIVLNRTYCLQFIMCLKSEKLQQECYARDAPPSIVSIAFILPQIVTIVIKHKCIY